MVKNISNGIPQIALELYIQFVEDGCHQNVTPLVMKNCKNSWSIMKFAIGPYNLVYVQCKALQNVWWSLALLAHWKYIVAFEMCMTIWQEENNTKTWSSKPLKVFSR